MVVDAEKKENERKRKRKTLSGEKKEVSSKKSLTGPTLLEMYVYSDLGKQTEGRSSLTNIRREEPEPALFEIPPDYKIIDSTSQ